MSNWPGSQQKTEGSAKDSLIKGLFIVGISMVKGNQQGMYSTLAQQE